MEQEIISDDGDLLSPRPRYYLRFDSFPKTASVKPRCKSIKEQATERVLASGA